MMPKLQSTPPTDGGLPVEAVAIFITALVTGRLLILKYQWPFLVQDRSVILIYLLGLAVALVFFLDTAVGVRAERRKFWVAATGFACIFLIVLSRQIDIRSTQPFPAARNDGSIQTEAAAKFLLRGINPYAANYQNTPFNVFFRPQSATNDRVAAAHYPYPPLIPLLQVPTVWLSEALHEPIDQQAIYAIIYALFAGFLLIATPTWRQRTWVLIILGNPLVWTMAVAGNNDIVYIAAMAVALVLLQNNNWRSAGVALGFALAAKQTAWLMVPILAIYILSRWRKVPVDRSGMLRFVVWTAAIAGVLLLPFFLWAPNAFYQALVVYPSGAIPGTYPISNISALQYLRIWRIIQSPYTYLPAWPFQALAGIPILMWAWRRLRRWPSVNTMMRGMVAWLLVITVFNRYGAENYYSAIALIAAVALVLGWRESTQRAAVSESPS